MRPERGVIFFSFLIFNQYILAVVVFVASNHFRAFHITLAGGAKERLAQTRFAFLMKIHALAARGGKQTDRNGQQAEAERSFPHGMSHRCPPAAFSGARLDMLRREFTRTNKVSP